MKRIGRQYLESHFAGIRMPRAMLHVEGLKIGRKHMRTLMRIEALYLNSRTTKRHPEHRAYPYPLRGLSITRVNQV